MSDDYFKKKEERFNISKAIVRDQAARSTKESVIEALIEALDIIDGYSGQNCSIDILNKLSNVITEEDINELDMLVNQPIFLKES